MHDATRYQSHLWRVRRRQVLEKAGYRCEECGNAGRIEVHHKIKISQCGTDDLENLEALCRRCHFRRHKRRIDVPERANWDDLIERYE